MTKSFNIYCDESCHLENDGAAAMVLGAVWCPKSASRNIAEAIRRIKTSHGLSPAFEIKWTKVSGGRLDLYEEVLDYFFSEHSLRFRALIVPDKSILNHQDFCQSHDEWYYRMYFDMLKVIIVPPNTYQIYIDIKDTCGTQKVLRLHEVLCNNIRDFKRQVVPWVQQVRSHEAEAMQLADLLIGCLSYASRGLASSPAKLALVRHFQQAIGQDVTTSTYRGAQKVNILRWIPRGSAK